MADGKKERDDHNSSCQRSPVPLFKTLGMKVFNLSKEHLDHQPQGSSVTGRTHLPYPDEYLWERYQLSRPGIVYLCSLYALHCVSLPVGRFSTVWVMLKVLTENHMPRDKDGIPCP